MSGQASIRKFFKPVASSLQKIESAKSPNKSSEITKQEESENLSPNCTMTPEKNPESKKKRKMESVEDETPQSPSATMTPDQKRRAMENKIGARIKLLSKQLEGTLHSNIGKSWFEALENEFDQNYFKSLSKFVAAERRAHPNKIFPPEDQVWSWTHHFDVKETKVVILGQDPYHGPKQAHGLCFSVVKGVPPPPSLVNMYKELSTDIEGFVTPSHGFLEGWAKQGVLLLNACLTVEQAKPNSHKDRGWEELTNAVIKYISQHCHGVVFLLWGSYAQKKALVVDAKKHHLLKSVHPSPLSVHRGFYGCKHFSQCNKILVNQGKTPIDWSNLN